MKLLQFAVRNHRCFRDETLLDLTRPSLRTNLPPADRSWSECIYPAAVIYGANASGKTTLLQALHYVRSAVAADVREQGLAQQPFRFADTSYQQPSSYKLDFVLASPWFGDDDQNNERRYHYEFSLRANAIQHELLQVFHSARPTKLFERHPASGGGQLPVALGSRLGVEPFELALARARVTRHAPLGRIANALVDELTVLLPAADRSWHAESAERELAHLVQSELLTQANIATIAEIADIGVSQVRLVDDAAIKTKLLQGATDTAGQQAQAADSSGVERLLSRLQFAPRLELQHAAQCTPDNAWLPLADQSHGTLRWLLLAAKLIRVLNAGTVLCIDQLEMGLHPYLTALIVQAFQDRETNPHGAQLLCTTHDTALLAPQLDTALDRGQIWFTEKDASGAAEFFCLREFNDVKAGTNVAKQLLEGRYGAVPALMPSLLHSIFSSEANNCSDPPRPKTGRVLTPFDEADVRRWS